ncbi:MEDS domain-containing protein [Natronolimnohabitans innermongolicus]|uniref:Response regulator receiver modulated GAF sensor protein n=1 Tax=Natronolimnohabitans innermongolicus JCM 12255 TaxID=1227499 RepID=L9WT29_9EURY|nr:MEDS domain-containing protein [Natronolimnohabitans innermongolicus]ELY52605.1 response regulator receiver modulated GAF sensor protein [Natronolimnohabitans innermongolicus JCM 12255]
MNQQLADASEQRPDHDHHALLYESQEDQLSTIVSFVDEGLRRGERCLCVTHEQTPDEYVDALRERVDGIDSAIESGQLVVESATDLYLSGGEFDPERVVNQLSNRCENAENAGCDGFRVAGEMSWALDHDVDFQRLERYERLVDELFVAKELRGVCQYDRERFPPEFLCNVLRYHPNVTRTGDVGPNYYYEYPTERTESGVSTDAIDRKLHTIETHQAVRSSLRERERCLSLLGQATEQLREADTDDVERIAGETVAEIADASIVCFYRYASDNGALTPDLVYEGVDDVDLPAVIDDVEGRAWDAFVDDAVRDCPVDASEALTGRLFPVGRHGVFFVAGSRSRPRSERNTPPNEQFIRAICGHTAAVLDRTEYERNLADRNEALERKNERLERVNRLNGVIRDVNRSIVNATTRTEILRDVCDRLVRETCASFAWYGTYDPTTESLEPRQTAGSSRGYLDALSLEEHWSRREPSGRTTQRRGTTIVSNVYDGPELANWQEQALKRGFQSILSLPVSYDGELYGVLSLYSETPETFDEEAAAVFDELSDAVAHAINSLNRKRALIADGVTELGVRITDADIDAVEFVLEHDCRIEIDDIVSDTDGATRLFCTASDVAPDVLRTYATASPAIDELNVLGEREGEAGYRFDCVVTDRCIVADLLKHNAVPQSASIEDGAVHLVVYLPQERRTRSFMEMLSTSYADVEIVGRQDLNQPVRRVSDIESELDEILTERQREILTIAFRSGYFERPREQTAEELAESLGVSHPTVNRHLREAERRLFSVLFDGGVEDDGASID